MQVNEIRLSNFRNYVELNLEPKRNINVFLGDNAQGKTNLIEAVNFASLGRSQRVTKEVDLINWNETQAIIFLMYDKLGINQTIAFELSASKSRRIILNEQPIRIKNLIGRFNTVLFSPEDLLLIKGSPSNRRKFIDAEISQASAVYFNELLTYNKILAQRNSLLKLIKDSQASENDLNLWNEQLIESAIKIIVKRLESIEKINLIARELQKKISSAQEELKIVYEVHGLDDEKLPDDLKSYYEKKLKSNQRIDIIRGTTTFGPQLDDLKFLINGRDIRLYGSQGQQRTTVLSLKLSEVEFLNDETGDYPILLLDDVMSELDSNRRRQLLNYLNEQCIQTFITATNAEYFPKDIQADYFTVQNGKVNHV